MSKKRYNTPQLLRHGDVEQITRDARSAATGLAVTAGSAWLLSLLEQDGDGNRSARHRAIFGNFS